MDSRRRLGDVARAVLDDKWTWEPLSQGAERTFYTPPVEIPT
jgi:hypothetical protein